MKDNQIISLYFSRDEQAIRETKIKYGSYCRKIAYNILSDNEDSIECENDAYLKIWNSIPPNKPKSLRAYIGKITRNIAIDLWKKNHTQKRYSGIETLFSELEDVASSKTIENETDLKELSSVINQWLLKLDKKDRTLFILRYWQGEKVNNIAKLLHTSPNKISSKLFCLRKKLKAELEKEGIYL